MPGFLKQSTASQSRAIGPFIGDTDFKTPVTGLTIANTDIKLVVNGGASANKNSGGGTHRVNGVYGVTFDATDTATVGEMEVSVVVAGALPVFDKFFVVEEAVYDALFGASAPGYLQPTTAGRTLDVSATGEAGIDWANIGSPTTAVNLSATNIDVNQVVASVSGAVGSVTGAVGSVTGNVGGNVVGSVASVTGAVGSVTGNVGGNVTGSVGSVATGGISASSFAANAIDAAALAASAVGEIADGVWDEAISGHLGAGSTGAALNAAGSAGDPWTTPLPGAYGSGTAGFIIGTNIDALISSRLASASYTAPLDAAGTATAVWNAATATYGSAGSYGLLIETNVDAQISTRSTLDAAGVRSAVGLASANLDTQLAALPTAIENADALLNRDYASVSDSNGRTLLQATRFLRNEWDVTGGTLTVYKEDGSTTAWTKTVSTDPAAEPIVGVSN